MFAKYLNMSGIEKLRQGEIMTPKCCLFWCILQSFMVLIPTTANTEDMKNISVVGHKVINASIDTTDSDLKKLEGLPEIEEVSLGACQITDAGLEYLKGMKKLQILNLAESKITDAGLRQLQLQTHPALYSLNVSNTKITDLGMQYIRHMAGIKLLNVDNTKITDVGLRQLQLQSPPVLERLYVSHTRITDAAMQYVGQMVNLQHLNMAGNQITDAGLKYLVGMRLDHLYISENDRITDAGLQYIGKLSNLTSLVLNSNQITDEGVKHLRELKNLYYLILCSNQITDAGMEYLCAPPVGVFGPSIGMLEFGGPKVTDVGLRSLRGQKNLSRLSLKKNTIKGRGLENLKELPNLVDLSLCDVNDDGLRFLGELRHLQQLTLVRPKFTEAGIVHLRKLSELSLIDLDQASVKQKKMVEQVLPNCRIWRWVPSSDVGDKKVSGTVIDAQFSTWYVNPPATSRNACPIPGC